MRHEFVVTYFPFPLTPFQQMCLFVTFCQFVVKRVDWNLFAEFNLLLFLYKWFSSGVSVDFVTNFPAGIDLLKLTKITTEKTL